MINWPLLGNNRLPDLDLRHARYRAMKINISQLGQQVMTDPEFPCDRSSGTLASTLGALYVIEGSVHGGRQILKSLEKNIPDLRPIETSFVEGFGSETGPTWKRFCDWMNSRELDRLEQAQACEAAGTAF